MRAEFSPRGTVPATSRRSWWAELTQNRIIALVVAMIVAVPLLAAPSDRSMTGIAAISLEAAALLLMTALLWRAKWDLRAENVRRFLGTGANLPVLLLMGLITLSCVLSPAKVFSIQELLRTGSGILLYFVVAYQFRQSKHLSLLVSGLLALAALVSFGAVAQYQLFSEDRASAIFGNPQPLASFVMLLLPVVASLAWSDKNPTRRIIAMIVSVLMVSCLMLTQGRSAWMGAAVGLAVLAYLSTRQTMSNKVAVPLSARKHLLVWPVLVALITVGFLAITKTQNASIDQRAVASKNLSSDFSWQGRVQAWKGAVKMIEAKPLTGWGTGTYPVYQHQFTGVGHNLAADGSGHRASLAEQAHNFYLQTAAELGLPGLLLTLAVFAVFLTVGFGRVGQLEPGVRRTLLIGSLAATSAFLVDAIASPSWQYGQTSMFMWLVLGIGTSCLRPRVKREEVAVQSHVVSRRITLMSRPVAAGLFLVLVSLLPTGYSSAQSFDYGDDDTNTGKVIFGITAGVAGAYVVYSLITGAGTGGGGAVAGGAVDGSSTGMVPVDGAVSPVPTPSPAP